MLSARFLRLAAVASVSAAFVWLFVRQVDPGGAVDAVVRLPLWALVGALAALAANLGFVCVRWHLLLRAAGFDVRLGRLFVALAAGTGANNVLPARAGDALRLGAVRAEGVPAFVVAGTLFAERLLDGVVLSAWLLAGTLLLGTGGPLFLTSVALAGGSSLGLVLAAFAAVRPSGAAALARRAGRFLPPRLAAFLENGVASFLQGLSSFRGGRTLALVLLASAGIWLADLALYISVGAGLGLGAGPGGYLALEGVGNLALAVPATAAGIGSFDYLTLMTAGGLALPMQTSAGFVVAVHAFTVVPVTALGLALLGHVVTGRMRVPAGEPARA